MAARFWVGGTGTWDGVDLTHISATSGGAGGASNPGAGDTMTFDSASGGGTVTVAYNPNVTSISMGGFGGTLDMNTRNPTMQTFNCSGTGTRTLTMGSGTWTITGNNGTVWDFTTITNLTQNIGTSTVNFTYAGSTGTRNISGGGTLRFYDCGITAGSDIITFSTAPSFHNLNFTGFTGNWGNASATPNISGNFVLGAGMTCTAGTGALTFSSTTSQTITMNGVLCNHPFIFDGVGGSWAFQDAFDNSGSTTSTITLTNGTLNTNGQNVNTPGIISSNTNVRTLTMGSSAITVRNGVAGTIFSFTVSTNLTITANTAVITVIANSADFDEGTLNWNGASMVITGASGVSMRGTSTWFNLTRTAPSDIDNALSIAGNKTITGTFTLKGTSTKLRMRLSSNQSQSLASTRVITAANIDFEYVNLTDIQGAGAANWDISAIPGGSGDGGGNVGITFTAPQTNYWFGTTGVWTDASKWFLGTGGTGGAGRVPLIQDMAIFDANSFVAAGNTVTIDFANISSTNWTGSLPGQTLTWLNNIRCYGSMILVPNTTLPATFGLTMVGRGANTLTPGTGNTFMGGVTISAVSNSVTLGSNLALDSVRTFTVFVGTFTANGYNVTAGIVDSTGTGVRTVNLGSGTWTVTGTGTVWQFSTTTNLTYNINTSTVIVANTSASSKTINPPPPNSFYNLYIPPGGAGAIIFTASGNRPITNSLSVVGPKTLTFNTVGNYIVANLSLDGTGGLITITSSTNGVAFTFSVAAGLVRAYNVSLKDSTATGGAYFQAVNSVDVSGNTGWNFVTEASGGSAHVGNKIASFGSKKPYMKVLDSNQHSYKKLGG